MNFKDLKKDNLFIKLGTNIIDRNRVIHAKYDEKTASEAITIYYDTGLIINIPYDNAESAIKDIEILSELLIVV